MFIVPTRLGSSGWKFKIASIVLEVFQLGTLFPAAAFTHTSPTGVLCCCRSHVEDIQVCIPVVFLG